jgi:hypothetical protein
MTPSLAFIVVACTLNVSEGEPPKFTTECKEIVEDLTYAAALVGDANDPQQVPMNPMTCIMSSGVMLQRFAENHPGLMPRKWTCKYIVPEQDI